MTSTKKLEGYLINLGITFEELNENTWLINDSDKGLEQVVVDVEEPLAIVRVVVMPTPTKNREEFFEILLKMNATDLIHGAYALSGDNVILIDTLQYETLNLEEFQASLDAIGLALAQHYPILSKYRDKGASGQKSASDGSRKGS
ncbi:MAG TPA: YbjN domain-containing protein [Spirochaetia bacterium]|nr:YbjN domain-containing protein [Spirochaetia bacterium]